MQDETLSTLKYASSARNIKNKVVANRDEESSAMLAMMDEIRMLRAQLAAAREGGDSGGGGGDPLLLRRHLRDAAAQQQLNALQEDRDRCDFPITPAGRWHSHPRRRSLPALSRRSRNRFLRGIVLAVPTCCSDVSRGRLRLHDNYLKLYSISDISSKD